jgi:hypothetical protein
MCAVECLTVGPGPLRATLRSPLVSPGFAGCQVPADRGQRLVDAGLRGDVEKGPEVGRGRLSRNLMFLTRCITSFSEHSSRDGEAVCASLAHPRWKMTWNAVTF